MSEISRNKAAGKNQNRYPSIDLPANTVIHKGSFVSSNNQYIYNGKTDK